VSRKREHARKLGGIGCVRVGSLGGILKVLAGEPDEIVVSCNRRRGSAQVTRLVLSTGMTSFGLPDGPTLGSTAQLTVPTLLTSISSAIFANQDC
jgi:hypothetical protein